MNLLNFLDKPGEAKNVGFLKMMETSVRNIIPDNSIINQFLNQKLIFLIIFMTQMIFGGLGVVYVPESIQNLGNNPLTRMILLTLIGFVATKNIALAITGAFSFVLILYLLRTEDEKEAALA